MQGVTNISLLSRKKYCTWMALELDGALAVWLGLLVHPSASNSLLGVGLGGGLVPWSKQKPNQ